MPITQHNMTACAYVLMKGVVHFINSLGPKFMLCFTVFKKIRFTLLPTTAKWWLWPSRGLVMHRSRVRIPALPLVGFFFLRYVIVTFLLREKSRCGPQRVKGQSSHVNWCTPIFYTVCYCFGITQLRILYQ